MICYGDDFQQRAVSLIAISNDQTQIAFELKDRAFSLPKLLLKGVPKSFKKHQTSEIGIPKWFLVRHKLDT